MSGFRGKLLRVNLSEKKITEEELDPTIGKEFLGGSGLGAYLYYHFIKQQKTIPEPFAPENPLYFLTGVLTGLPAFCTARSSFCTRSPQTNIWGESNIGGKIGPSLKFAGYDGIIIEGASEEPVLLVINNEEAKIISAKQYWGLGAYETQEQIRADLNNKGFEVACIGPAGENLVKYSCIMTYGGRAAGRTGMGAVFGSKKLKGIAIYGSNTKFDLPERFKEVAKKGYESIKEDFLVELFQEFGTSGYVDVALDMYGDMSIRNWSEGVIENGEAISGITMAEAFSVGKKACYRCPISCGREIEIKEGVYKTRQIDGPEYETLASFGTNLLITDLEAICYANFKANDYGIDTISTGATIGVLYDLIEKGFIPKSDLPKDISCKFGDPDSLLTLLDMIAKKEGIGKLLAEGSKTLAEKYGHIELAPQVAGLEAAYHDPRAFSSMALMYVTSPRGACHLNGDAYLAQQGLLFPEIDVDNLPGSRFESTNIVKPITNLQSYRQVYNAFGICQFFNPSASIITDLLNMAINENLQPMDLILIGDRLFALKRLINLMLGWKPDLEILPKVMQQKLAVGPTEENVPDVELMLEDWYKIRNYDRKTGKPLPQELARTKLTEFL